MRGGEEGGGQWQWHALTRRACAVLRLPGLVYDDAPAAVEDSGAKEGLLLAGEEEGAYYVPASSGGSLNVGGGDGAATLIDQLQTPSLSKATAMKLR